MYNNKRPRLNEALTKMKAFQMQGFKEATERLDPFSDDYEYYNEKAKATNRHWVKMETYQWYDKNDFWGKLPIKRVPLMGDY